MHATVTCKPMLRNAPCVRGRIATTASEQSARRTRTAIEIVPSTLILSAQSHQLAAGVSLQSSALHVREQYGEMLIPPPGVSCIRLPVGR